MAMMARVAMAARRAVKGKAGNGKGKVGKGADGGKAKELATVVSSRGKGFRVSCVQ